MDFNILDSASINYDPIFGKGYIEEKASLLIFRGV